MCYPLLIAAIGAGISAYGSYQQAKNAEKMAERNAQYAELQAQSAIERGGVAERQATLKAIQTMRSQRAAAAANGFSVNSGSPLDSILDTAQEGAQDALIVRSNAETEAWGYRQQAGNYRAQGEIDSIAGKTAALGSLVSSVGGISGGIGSFGTSGGGAGSLQGSLTAGGGFSGSYGTVADSWYTPKSSAWNI